MNSILFEKSRRALLSIIAIVILLLQMGAVPADLPTLPADGRADLVRVHVGDQAALNELAGLNLAIFAQMSATVVVRADAAQQVELARLGFEPSVVDTDAPADGAGYYTLYAMPDDLLALQARVPLLAVEDRQALAHLTPAQVAEAEQHGAGVMPVAPFRLTPAAARPQAATAAPQTLAPDLVYSPLVQQMVNMLTQSTLTGLVSKLSGEEPALIDGSFFTLNTRSSLADIQYTNKATRFGWERFQAAGLPVDFDYFYLWNQTQSPSYQRRSVIAEQAGLTQPNRIYLLTAHLDSTSGSYATYAPGADDNASGSAAVMAIADILNDYHFACTLRYALFTGEEQGLWGSVDYAGDVVRRGDPLQAVLNLDMLGYNSVGTPATIELHTRPENVGDLSIAYLFRDAVDAYLPRGALTVLIRQDNLRFSDHAPFWDRGFPGLLAIEDWEDHTPYYHQTTDRLATLNMPYYTYFAKAALATFAHMGCLLDDGLAGSVTHAPDGSQLPNARVSAWKTGETPQTTLTNPQGNYYLDLDDGTYTVKFSAADHHAVTLSNVQVVSNEGTTRNQALGPCSTVQSVTWTADVSWPEPGQEVSFSAASTGGLDPVTLTWSFGDGGSASGAQAAHTFAQPGAYAVKVTANNQCDYEVEYTSYLFVGIDPHFMPIAFR